MAACDPPPDPGLSKVSASIERRLRERFQTVPETLVRDCIEDATLELAGARVRGFLYILIERRAADALRARTSGH